MIRCSNAVARWPPPLARRIIEQVRSSAGLEETLGRADGFDPATATKRFTIAMREAMQAAILPPLMVELGASAPGIDLLVVRVDRRDIERELASAASTSAWMCRCR